MPACRMLARVSERSLRYGWSALLLTLILTISSPIFWGTLVNSRELAEPNEVTAHSMISIGSGLDSATVVVSPGTTLRPSQAGDTLEPQTGKILKEIGKQTVDQPGHFLIGAGPIWASRYLIGVPWYGWVVAPLLAYREWLQWPSKRWWDPPLDWAFLGLGAVVATWRRRSTPRSRNRLTALRHRIARGLAFCLGRRGDRLPHFSHGHAATTPGSARGRHALSAAAGAGSPQ